MDLTNDDVLKILKIVDESGYNDIRLEIGDLKLHVQKQGSAEAGGSLPFAETSAPPTDRPAAAAPRAPAAEAPATPAAAPQAGAAIIPEGTVAVCSPILGTFYRAPSPGEKPFVEVGQKVAVNDTICLIEVMKLFNSVKAEVSGTIVSILTENGKMVEHGQTLMLIKPDA